jgi:hypothetical protein
LFRRAYIRAYAQAIGLDPGDVVREFLQLCPDLTEEASPPSKIAVAAKGDQPSAPPTRLRYLLESAMRSLPGRPRESVAEPPDAAASPLARYVGPTFRSGTAPPLSVESPIIVDESPDSAQAELELAVVAQLCTAFGRAATRDELAPLLGQAAALLDAIGLIVWAWDREAGRLRPELSHGYSDRILAQIPALERDAPNATAGAFRDEQPCTVDGRDQASGALVVPVMAAGGCAGVLAIELRGKAPGRAVPALATIFASLLARWIDPEPQVQAANRWLA